MVMHWVNSWLLAGIQRLPKASSCSPATGRSEESPAFGHVVMRSDRQQFSDLGPAIEMLGRLRSPWFQAGPSGSIFFGLFFVGTVLTAVPACAVNVFSRAIPANDFEEMLRKGEPLLPLSNTS